MSRAKRVARTSPDLVAEQAERLRELFPEAFTEGKVGWDRLRATLGEIVDERPERYSLTWAGKAGTHLAPVSTGRERGPII